MKHFTKWLPVTLALAIPVLGAGCESNNTGSDSGPVGTDSGMTDAGMTTPMGCAGYCTTVMGNCTGANAQYASMAECMSVCADLAWPEGEVGAMSGNTIQCRIYHGGAPAMDMPSTHCPHAGSTGSGVCGSVDFRTEAPAMYTRVDRMGMPAVSTALIGSAMKNAYNDADPDDDAAGTFVPELAATLTAVHTALDDDLMALSLPACSMVTLVGGLPECFGQTYDGTNTVASLVLPDTLHIDPDVAAGFPNGRRLPDLVIDVTLAVILLRLGGAVNAGTLAGVPLNPPENDLGTDGAFLDTFPYLHPPHAP